MASMWRRAMLYLGLGPDDEYEDYDVDDAGRVPVDRPPRYAPQASMPEPQEVKVHGTVRPLQPQPVEQVSGIGSMTPAGRQRTAVVRPIPVSPSAKPHVMSPISFNEAQEIADKYKGSAPVIVNLQAADRDLSRRLIDFASGLCYGLGGSMERVAHQVYLLTPSNVEVSDEDRRRLQESGLYD
ncbi:MAG: cell division protein SepF [Acidimicrobiales bacterium]